MTKTRAQKKQQALKRRDQALALATADAVAKHIANSTQQLESYLAIQHYMATGKRLPAFHGWPISPDFGYLLIELIEEHQYDLVVEFGSGSSTVLIAQALANVKQRTGKHSQQVAFEHLENYHAKTQALLNAAGLARAVQLVHAPLAPYNVPNGEIYSYYSCHHALAQIANSRNPSDLRILVVVDGPPAKTGPLARYPALHAIWPLFDGATCDILLDDYNRPDEREIVRYWVEVLKKCNFDPEITRYFFEKEAALLSVNASILNK